MSGHIDDQDVRQDAFTTILTAVQRAKDEAKSTRLVSRCLIIQLTTFGASSVANEALLRRSFDAAHGEWELERAQLIKEIDDLKRYRPIVGSETAFADILHAEFRTSNGYRSSNSRRSQLKMLVSSILAAHQPCAVVALPN